MSTTDKGKVAKYLVSKNWWAIRVRSSKWKRRLNNPKKTYENVNTYVLYLKNLPHHNTCIFRSCSVPLRTALCCQKYFFDNKECRSKKIFLASTLWPRDSPWSSPCRVHQTRHMTIPHCRSLLRERGLTKLIFLQWNQAVRIFPPLFLMTTLPSLGRIH